MVKLSVNVNKIATLRNSRGGSRPDVLEFADQAIKFGAQGITVHPRPDERHITRKDALALPKLINGRVEYNIEGYPDERYIAIVAATKPDQATLVPDPPDALTSNAGWKVSAHKDFLKEVIAELKKHTGRVSLFMETDLSEIEAAKEVGADRIEFYTEPFADAYNAGKGEESFQEFDAAAKHAQKIGLGINAGHDLNLDNLKLLRNLTALDEVSIGHALVIDALKMGWENTIKAYLKVLSEAG